MLAHSARGVAGTAGKYVKLTAIKNARRGCRIGIDRRMCRLQKRHCRRHRLRLPSKRVRAKNPLAECVLSSGMISSGVNTAALASPIEVIGDQPYNKRLLRARHSQRTPLHANWHGVVLPRQFPKDTVS